MNKTSIGLNENVAGLLCYLLGWVTGLIFILIEQENKFVRFHAMQSILVGGIATLLSWIPVLNVIVGIAYFILWIVLMVKAYQGQKYMLPWIGNLAENWTA